MEIIPDIIIPHIPQSGATELAELFSLHSQISTFDNDSMHSSMYGRNVRSGQALMKKINTNKTHYTTLLTTSLSEKSTLRLIKKHPHSHYIITVKNPLQRMISDWEIRAKNGKAPLSLSSYLQQALNRLIMDINVPHYDALIEMVEFYNHWANQEAPNLAGSATLITNGFYDLILAPYQKAIKHLTIAPSELENYSPEYLIQYYLQHLNLDKEVLKIQQRPKHTLSNLLQHSNIASMAKIFLPASFFSKPEKVKVVLSTTNDLLQNPYLHDVISEIYRIMNRKTHQLLQDQFDIQWQYRL